MKICCLWKRRRRDLLR